MEWLVAGYYALAALAVGVAALLTIQTWEHRRYARSRARHRVGGKSKGLIALLVPCKGADADLESNLRPLFEQDYEPYELVFAVEGLDDPACRAIQRLMAQYPGLPAQLVTAGTTTISGQKNSFHDAVNVKIASVAAAGPRCGTQI